MNLRPIAQCTVAAAIFLFGINAAQAENQAATETVTRSESATHLGQYVTLKKTITISGNEGQQQLLDLLRETPTVAGAVARDPSLLGEQSYIQRTNPKLAAFLVAHPEIARNPDYYLFTNMQGGNGNRTHALERQLWPEYLHGSSNRDDALNTFITNDLAPIIIVPAFFFALAWGLRSLLQGRSQSKLLKTQSDLQTRLIDKLGSSQELTAYLASDAGQKLLTNSLEPASAQTAPLPFTFERILRPLQVGAMLILISVAVFVLSLGRSNQDVVSVFGSASIILFATGLGFILSAGIAWFTAKKLGLMPVKAPKESALAPTSTIDRP